MMSFSTGIVASFSQNCTQFAFQSNIAQKNSIDVYPLDEANNYKINSSLVSHIDYENNDLDVSSILFSGWCSNGIEQNLTKSKRKRDDQNGDINIQSSESFFVNTFTDGKIVVFSSNGKNIVNIIQNKYEITHTDTEDSFIWILDSDKAVKKFNFNQTKPVKTFHLTDGKDEDITGFQVLKTNDNEPLLAISTSNFFYVIDPSKRRPTTYSKLEVGNAVSSFLLPDNTKIIIADENCISLYDLESTSKLKSWEVKAKRLIISDTLIISLTTDGLISVVDMDKKDIICNVNAPDSKIIEFSVVGANVMLAWLNVNEPNFDVISLNKIKSKNTIVINTNQDINNSLVTEETNTNKSKASDKESVPPEKTKVSKAKQDEMIQDLLEKLENNAPKDEILAQLVSSNWVEDRIKNFIDKYLISPEVTSQLCEVIVSTLQKNPWVNEDSLLIWLEWIILWRGAHLNSSKVKHVSKQIKQLKSSLRSSGETLPMLLSMQGRLEMLKTQAILRKELAELNIEDEYNNEFETIEQGEGHDAMVENEDSLTYANGESDAFYDASAF
ncbi:hypothetical protein Kpol_1067p21 [Vanderwaltozyma polyspora DSM 70294]|uniref:Small-subunit processome Utp12 domain-containing protein n=1 Tax=Vanderwaltozyma polyspora (strain ATCC 22028 / DSM 70294 / BCRC 21397 / CBS 2163 / NBRC 10782 / NRRL Y-8283 / UCD 57-17) TaxID=436907 RepID=A7TNW6_VANPO|nr:uncharacterized protein Kpol_1067p21 [Vanderwaltozyma polyspora DSM 70294]EDO16049.1 hypothetical protein Kpol_1067p21 [Vanderwaltozyma polyspora DSM 70294]